MNERQPFTLPTSCYAEQSKRWPESGRHILAQYDDETILVYQAYRPEIGHFAARHSYFGGEFKYTRMSWIKTNFLWMMYRSDWGRSQGQEVVLAIRLRRAFFDSLLQQAVFSSFGASGYSDRDEWKAAVNGSNVRLQWDPIIYQRATSANDEPYSLAFGENLSKRLANVRQSRSWT